MRVLAAVAVIALALTGLLIVLLRSDTGDSPQTGAVTVDAMTVDCEDAILGSGNRGWRQRSTVVGDFGLFGPLRNNFRHLSRNGDGFQAKLPAVIEGTGAVTLQVPPEERGRVRLVYGANPPASAVKLVPCSDKKVTAWAGGLDLADRRPVTLTVVPEGSTEVIPVEVGRPSTTPG